MTVTVYDSYWFSHANKLCLQVLSCLSALVDEHRPLKYYWLRHLVLCLQLNICMSTRQFFQMPFTVCTNKCIKEKGDDWTIALLSPPPRLSFIIPPVSGWHKWTRGRLKASWNRACHPSILERPPSSPCCVLTPNLTFEEHISTIKPITHS